jgi:hypothetical protein
VGVKQTLTARSDARADGAAGEHAWQAGIREDRRLRGTGWWTVGAQRNESA